MPLADQGSFKDRYKLIPRVLIFATRGESILLLKGSPNKPTWANLYNGVGGHIEKGEDILTAARREFYEETGLKLTDPWLCAVVTIDTGNPIGIGMYVFRGSVSNEKPKPSPEGVLEWIRVDELHSLPLVEDLPVLLPKILEMKKKCSPLYIHYHYDEFGNLIVEFVA